MKNLSPLHIGVEIVLAGLVWLLLRRQNNSRALMAVVEAGLGLVKKRFEAATMGLHIRLLLAERQLKGTQGALPGSFAVVKRSHVLRWPRRQETGDPPQLSRGEMDLLHKVRQISQE